LQIIFPLFNFIPNFYNPKFYVSGYLPIANNTVSNYYLSVLI